ncbi:hypothetical protein BaRGS_00038464 [Batillaria attramentaria]|uniref:BHLH domain-containing protein n=1 Tax=Batillaria attramentaria TaxID=370345 RepID=A0ABD0J781_9CAEN
MGDCADPKDGLSFTSFGDEDPSTFDELLLEEIPVSEFIMQDLVASADIDSNLCFEEDSSESSPGSHKKKCSSRKDRTPDTMLAILEKHRHSERIRHHTLNERLKVICKLVPGSADDGRETKVTD